MTLAGPLDDVSRETSDRLGIYASLLREWNPRINLVSRQTLAKVETRHFLDSAQLMGLAPAGAATWADLGSGGGFPGLVIAILAAERAPRLRLTLVESDQRKAVFLRTAARKTGVDVSVIARRIEDIPPLHADIISARALAPLAVLLEYCDRHLASDGVALFLKGASRGAEIDEALERWRFRCEELPSVTSPDGAILKLGDLSRV
jgi:16S rRNA (guanine527-N7)-methyltransferase